VPSTTTTQQTSRSVQTEKTPSFEGTGTQAHQQTGGIARRGAAATKMMSGVTQDHADGQLHLQRRRRRDGGVDHEGSHSRCSCALVRRATDSHSLRFLHGRFAALASIAEQAARLPFNDGLLAELKLVRHGPVSVSLPAIAVGYVQRLLHFVRRLAPVYV